MVLGLLFSSAYVQKAFGQAQSVVEEEKSVFINDYPYYPKFFNTTISGMYSRAEKGDFAGAAKVLLERDSSNSMAIDFGSQTFYGSRINPDTVSSIREFSEKMKGFIQEYASMQQKLEQAKNGFTNSLKGGSVRTVQSELNSTLEILGKLLNLRDSVISESEKAGKIFSSLKETREVQDASYLSYMIKFLTGTGRTENTGLTGVMNVQWLKIQKDLTDSIFGKASTVSMTISKELDSIDPTSYGKTSAQLKDAIESLKALQPMISRLSDFGDSFMFAGGSKSHAQSESTKKSGEALKQIASKTEELTLLMSEISSQIRESEDFIDKSVADAAQDIRDGQDSTSQFYMGKSNSFAELANGTEALTHESWISEFRKVKEEWPSLGSFLNSYVKACEKASKACSEKSSETIILTGTRLISAAKQMYVEDMEKYQAIMGLIPDASNEEARQYPTKLLNSINTFKQSIALDVSMLKNSSALLSTGSLSQTSNIQYMQRKITDSIESIGKLSSNTDSLVKQAQAQQKEALQAQSQIDIYYNRARTSFNAEDYNAARNSLDKASSLYNSLIDSLKRDASIQEETYDKISALKVSIITRQQPLLMQEIRKFKDSAKTAYYAGNFDEAYTQISQAEETMTNWAKFMDMDVQSDEELETLKSRINTALEMKSGKKLVQTDPLYPEMSQILSISNQYYARGQSLISSGNTEEGRKLLNSAKSKLNELKIVYPRNQEANLLSMKIDQILDPKQFSENFKTKIDELKNVNYAKNDSLARESYSDLQDLYALEPKYPGLSDFMYQVELDLGLRKKVVDIKPVETPQILASEVVILSASDEAKYQQAINYLQNGNVIAAKSNLQELLSKPANRRSAKILKLQKRLTDMGY